METEKQKKALCNCFDEPLIIVASYSCWLTEEEPGVIFFLLL